MKHENGYWIDENGNRWNDCDKERAKELSSSMINCHDCCNCSYCRGCYDCCNCSYCRYCRGCYDCRDCRGCRGCRGCYDCRGCRGYKIRPMQYVTSEIGSRNDNTIFYYGETDIGMSLQIVCGCFRGNLEVFEQAVLETHANNDIYREQYLKEIKKVKALFELEVIHE